MKTETLKYIVFMLNPDVEQYLSTGERIDTHDGEIFSDLEEAKTYAVDAIEEKYCTRFVIGRFLSDSSSERMSISLVETFGFKKDKKSINQMHIFNELT